MARGRVMRNRDETEEEVKFPHSEASRLAGLIITCSGLFVHLIEVLLYN